MGVEGSGDIANCIYCPWKYVEKSKLMNALPSMAGERMETDEAGNLYLPSSCEYLRGHSGEILTYLCTQMDCPNECSSPFAFTTSPCEFTTKETVTSAYFLGFALPRSAWPVLSCVPTFINLASQTQFLIKNTVLHIKK